MERDIKKNIVDCFIQKFNKKPIIIASPARINIIGEHTDYNEGFVLPAAINYYIYFAFTISENNYSSIYALDINEELRIDFKQPIKPSSDMWANYITGTVHRLKELTGYVENFNLVFGGNIPNGAGISSSAALEGGISFGLNHLFNLKLDLLTLAQAGQWAEHHFVGVKCGLMDQFANLFGKTNQVIKLDCRDFSYEYAPANFGKYQLLLIDTKVKHSLGDSAYNKRREACESGVSILNEELNTEFKSLREISLNQLSTVKHRMSNEIFQRCSYVIEEIERLENAIIALKRKDFIGLGELMFQTHLGLSEKYEVSCEELDYLVNLARENPSIIGSRMMGGGFGGCTINLISEEMLDEIKSEFGSNYLGKFGYKPAFYEVEIVNGTNLIS